MSDPLLLAETERKMLKNFNLYSYFYYIFLTVFGLGLGDRVKISRNFFEKRIKNKF